MERMKTFYTNLSEEWHLAITNALTIVLLGIFGTLVGFLLDIFLMLTATLLSHRISDPHLTQFSVFFFLLIGVYKTILNIISFYVNKDH